MLNPLHIKASIFFILSSTRLAWSLRVHAQVAALIRRRIL